MEKKKIPVWHDLPARAKFFPMCYPPGVLFRRERLFFLRFWHHCCEWNRWKGAAVVVAKKLNFLGTIILARRCLPSFMTGCMHLFIIVHTYLPSMLVGCLLFWYTVCPWNGDQHVQARTATAVEEHRGLDNSNCRTSLTTGRFSPKIERGDSAWFMLIITHYGTHNRVIPYNKTQDRLTSILLYVHTVAQQFPMARIPPGRLPFRQKKDPTPLRVENRGFCGMRRR